MTVVKSNTTKTEKFTETKDNPKTMSFSKIILQFDLFGTK